MEDVLIPATAAAQGLPCQNWTCLRPRSDFPMAFRSDTYCSDNCRKTLGQDLPQLDARH
jgi:hypothetical protein